MYRILNLTFSLLSLSALICTLAYWYKQHGYPTEWELLAIAYSSQIFTLALFNTFTRK